MCFWPCWHLLAEVVLALCSVLVLQRGELWEHLTVGGLSTAAAMELGHLNWEVVCKFQQLGRLCKNSLSRWVEEETEVQSQLDKCQ